MLKIVANMNFAIRELSIILSGFSPNVFEMSVFISCLFQKSFNDFINKKIQIEIN